MKEVVNLTAKQEKFIQGIVAGMSQREAYRQAYDVENTSDAVVDVRACELMKNSKVSVRRRQLLDEFKEKAIWTREMAIEELKWLKDRAKEDIISSGIKQANSNAFYNSVKEMNTLEGLYNDNKDDNKKQESEVASLLRRIADEGVLNG